MWRCADMTGEKITLSRSFMNRDANTALAAIRFVPMTDEEIAKWKYEDTRTDTKSFYATDDMHNRMVGRNMENIDDWYSVVTQLRHSDAEWISVEEIRGLMSGKIEEDPDEHQYFRMVDRLGQKQISKIDFDEVLKRIADKAREIGLKSSVSFRMGAWGMEFPYDQTYFDCPFLLDHPEWWCKERNGEAVNAMSYAYPEVRKFVIDILVNAARSGCDAVTLISHRGIPYVLFEQPVCEKFFELYGEYPNELPMDDPRVNKVHCDIMTGFFRELRAALDENFPDRHVDIHLRSLFSLADSKYIGLDIEELAREGLVNAVISYPSRFYEIITDSMRKDTDPTRIDLDKFTAAIRTNEATMFHRDDFDFMPPYENSRGELCGPESQAARIAEWNDLCDRYGIKVYLDIMPRRMPNAEFKQRVMDLYALGARNISLWDTFCRYPWIPMWNLVRQFGHKDELANIDDNGGEIYRFHRSIKYANGNINRFKPSWGG